MPVIIRNHSNVKENERGEFIAELCGEHWEMPIQIDALEVWLLKEGHAYPKGIYTADLGYSPREGACGGGTVLKCKAMKIMVSIGMDLYLSEYPAHEEES